jgi:hypothetical protein
MGCKRGRKWRHRKHAATRLGLYWSNFNTKDAEDAPLAGIFNYNETVIANLTSG